MTQRQQETLLQEIMIVVILKDYRVHVQEIVAFVLGQLQHPPPHQILPLNHPVIVEIIIAAIQN